MTWQPLEFIGECVQGTSKKIRDRHAELLTKAEKLNAERAAIDERARVAKAGNLTAKTVTELEAIRGARIATWQTELDLRSAYDSWIEDYLTEVAALHVKAYEAIEPTAADITARLVSIGYVDAPDLHQAPGKITRDMILKHPEHIAARNKEHDLSNDSVCLRRNKSNNLAARGQVFEGMERIKESLTSA